MTDKPRKRRTLQKPLPRIKYFKPVGVPMQDLEEVILTGDEFEALRLVHLGSHYQSEAAHLMGISRQTLGRILNNAHTKITTALSRGLAIRIQGGDYVDFPEVEPRRRRFRGGRKG